MKILLTPEYRYIKKAELNENENHLKIIYNSIYYPPIISSFLLLRV
jgi:hypothetical protein